MTSKDVMVLCRNTELYCVDLEGENQKYWQPSSDLAYPGSLCDDRNILIHLGLPRQFV